MNRLYIAIIITILLPLWASGERGNHVVSSFTTSVQDQDSAVKTNIGLAAKKLNGIEIPSGATLSFNSTVGEGSAANGYLTGRVLYENRVDYEPGGGVCQVSSTLFNALLTAGCRIVERHRHFQPVSYVRPGLDATIKYGKKDLRMKNPWPYSIFIFSDLNDRSLTITVRSHIMPQQTYEVYTMEERLALPFQESGDVSIRPALSIYVYRKKIQNSGIVEDVLLYKDFYPPVKSGE